MLTEDNNGAALLGGMLGILLLIGVHMIANWWDQRQYSLGRGRWKNTADD